MIYIKIFPVSIFTLFSFINVGAQKLDTLNTFTIGAKIYFDNSGNLDINVYKLDVVNYEINLDKPISKHFGIQTGIHVVTKATVLEDLPFYYHYISIPLGMQYRNRFFYSLV